MRILIVVHGYPPDETAGTELYTYEAANALAAVGHDVHVFAANPTASAPGHVVETIGGVSVERHRSSAAPEPDGTPWLRDAEAEDVFSAALDRVRPDVVHVINAAAISPRVAELARAAAPLVVAPTDFSWICPRTHIRVGTRHPLRGPLWGLNCFGHTEARSPRWLAALVRRGRLARRIRWHLARARAFRSALARADLILTPSDFVRREYLRFGVDPARVEALPLGLEETSPVPARERSEVTRIGCVGALVEDKGADLVVRAFRGLDTDARLVIRGHPVDQAFADRVARSAERDERVDLGGAVEPGRILDFLATLDLLVVPTRVHESFSRIAREAFLVGVPVLAAAAGALPEVVTPGRNGALFTPGSATSLRERLRELLAPGALDELQDFPHVKTMREHAHELVARYERIAA